MIKIIGVKTNKEYYISSDNSSLNCLIINGEIPSKTFRADWFSVNEEPRKVEKTVRQPNINHRFELIDDSPWIGKVDLPKIIPKSEVMEENNEGYCGWKEEFKHLQSLYEEKSDKQPDKIEPVEFEYETILEIPEIKIAEDFSYTVQDRKYESEGTSQLKTQRIKHQIIDQIIFPSITLPNTSSKLTSEDSYKIIREHVKNNIDGRFARITNDYRFCFTVKKIILLTQDIHVNREILTATGRSYKHKKYREYFIKSREVEIFAITYSPENYKGCKPIAGFEGKNHQDLKKNIDQYLNDLMARINEPLKDCPRCNGLGIID